MRTLLRTTYCRSSCLMVGFLLCFVPVSWGQPTITTLVGNGIGVYAGDGGPASLANLACPDDIALDSYGNMYIADACSDVVRRVDAATNIMTTYAGLYTGLNVGSYSGDGGPATLALLNYPSGIACDTQGNLYIADYYNCVIRKVSVTTGVITTVAGQDPPVPEGYSGDGGPASSAKLNNPTLVRFDNQGNMLISDTGNNVIRKVNAATGVITTVAGFWPGNPGYTGDGGPATLARLNGCESMITNPFGDLYISDTNNNVVRKVSGTTGLITTVVGSGAQGYSGDGGPATLASLYFDNGTMACDSGGNLFMTDDVNNVIRRVDAVTGIITTVAGQGPPASEGYSGDGGPPLLAQFDHTESLCFDNNCDLLVVDYSNNAVRKITGLASICHPSPTSTSTPTSTPTCTGTPTPTYSTTATESPTLTATPSATPTHTLTATNTYTPTVTTTLSSTPTSSPTPTMTSTRTPSTTPLPSLTPSPTSINTLTPTSTPTASSRVPEIFYVSKNAMRRCTGPVSIYVQCPSAPGGYSLNIFNTAGELVRKLGSGHLQIPLVQSYLWDGTNKYGELCASGVYIVSLNDPLDYKTKRILLIR